MSLSGKTALPSGHDVSDPVAALRFLHDFQQKAYWESTKVLMSFAAAYLALTTATLGYVLTRDLKPLLQRMFAATALTVSVLFFLIFSVWAHGLLRQITMLDDTSRRLDPDLYTKLDMGGLFRHWRRVNLTTMISIYIVGAFLVSGILVVLRGSL